MIKIETRIGGLLTGCLTAILVKAIVTGIERKKYEQKKSFTQR